MQVQSCTHQVGVVVLVCHILGAPLLTVCLLILGSLPIGYSKTSFEPVVNVIHRFQSSTVKLSDWPQSKSCDFFFYQSECSKTRLCHQLQTYCNTDIAMTVKGTDRQAQVGRSCENSECQTALIKKEIIFTSGQKKSNQI